METKQTDKNNLIKLKAKVFFEKKIPVHVSITTDDNKRFYFNGKIKELKPDYFVVMDSIFGKSIIFYSQVFLIDRYLDKNKPTEQDFNELFKNIEGFQKANKFKPEDYDEVVKK